MSPRTETPTQEKPITVAHEDKALGLRRYTLLFMLASALLVIFVFSRMRNRAAKPVAVPKAAAATSAPTPVQLSAATLGSLARIVEVSGDITALTQITLSPKITARVTAVNAREGDNVHKGQLLITLDTNDLDSQLRSAQDALAAAQARANSARVSERLQTETSRIQIQTAGENLRSAQAQLSMVKTGARRQELQVSRSQVNVAQATYEDALTNYNRSSRLFKQGAIAKVEVDTSRTRLAVARAQLESAKQSYSLTQEGSRPEQVIQAEAAVASARQNLDSARENQRQVAIKHADVLAAQSAVGQAKAAVSIAQQNRSNAFLYAPVGGVVAKRSVEPGQLASLGSPLLQITVPGTVFFGAAVAEKDLAQIRAGQSVDVGVDAIPNERFRGTINKIYPTGDVSSRTFIARITLSDGGGRLRPGMFARGAVRVSNRQDVVLIPKSALSVAGASVPLDAAPGVATEAAIFQMKGGKAVRKQIKIGAPNGNDIEVVSGLRPGEKVITSGSRLDEGDTIVVNS